MDNGGEWFLLARGDVLTDVKNEAALRLLNDFGVQISDIADDEFRVDPMQNADRRSDSYRIFIKRATLEAHQRRTPT
ncbi:hypothetical protein [Dactylosporangium maewongense]